MTTFGPTHPQDSVRTPAPPRGWLLASATASLLAATALVAVFVFFAWPSSADFSPDLFTIDAVDVPQSGDDPILIDGGRFFLVHLAAGASSSCI